MRGARIIFVIFVLAFVLSFPVRSSAQVPPDSALTNADIVKMTKAGIPDSIILREIQMLPSDLNISPAALVDMKKHGVSDSVLGAIVDSGLAANGSASASQQIPYIPARSATQGLHHVPSFEADIQLDSKTRGKLSVGQNHIKLERAGVPLFSLKWKETHPAK